MDYLIHHFLRNSAKKFPEKEALVCREERLTYARTWEYVLKLADHLRQAGLQKGDRVGIYLEAGVDQAIAIFGILAAGGVFVPINSAMLPEQVHYMLFDCQTVGLITTHEKYERLTVLNRSLEPLRFWLLTHPENRNAGEKCFGYLAEIYHSASPRSLVDVGISLDLAGILYTSGSTGKPKGVMLSHSQIMAGSAIVSDYLEISEHDKILAVLPFNFDAGLNQLMTAFQNGATLVIMPFVFAREIVMVLATEKITGLAGVPTLWNLLVQKKSGLDQLALPSFRYLTNTGGVLPQAVLQSLRKILPHTQIFLMYGLTEAFRSTYLPPEELDRRPTSMGKAIPNTELFVVNNQGKRCKAGEIGELVHRGPTVSMGYWAKPELTEAILRPHPFLPPEVGNAENVCYSGDLVTVDDDGFFYFVGRRDAMIKTSGYRVSRTEVEEILYRLPQVKEAAVIGVPDDILGQSIKAVVVLQEGTSLKESDLRSYCFEHLPRFMVPKEVLFVDAIPKTSNGKVDYPFLEK
jgi:acyl-CoA ligase (AMP-forming) (exosortase A-associated)